MFYESNHNNVVVNKSPHRFPRLFLGLDESNIQHLSGMLLMLPDRTFIPLISISTVGIVISTNGILGQIRIGQILECKLKFAFGEEPLSLKLKVIRLTAKMAYLVLDGSIVESRIKLDQNTKDKIIFTNIYRRSTHILPKSFEKAQWWTGPFDTNFLYWSEDGVSLQKAIIEYDGIIFIYENKNGEPTWWLKKSLPSVVELHGYVAPWVEHENQRISMGASWQERLLRLIETSGLKQELGVFSQLLKAKVGN